MLFCAATCIGCKKNSIGAQGGASAGNSSASSGLRKVKIGYVGLTCDTDMFVAYEKGFFKDEGLDAELVKFEWAALRDGLSLGQVDATHHLVMFLLKPIEQGVDIRLTGAVHRGCLRVQAGVNSGIKTVADLKGRRIGVPGLGTPPHILAIRALVAAGLDPKKDVEFKVFAADQFSLAFDRGLIDACGDSEPIGTMLLQTKKVHNVVDQATDAPYKDEYCCAVMVSGKLVRNEPEIAAKITRAILKGSKWVNTNPTAAARLAVEKNYIAATPELNAIALSHLAYVPSIEEAPRAVISAAAEMKKAGLLEPRTDPDALAKRGFAPLPGVSEEWIKELQVEKVAGGGPMLEAEVAEAMAKITPADAGRVKTCCIAKK